MFTGIVQGVLPVVAIDKRGDFLRLAVSFDGFLAGIPALGASVAINGVCLTVAQLSESLVYFDVIKETLVRTNLGMLNVGDMVNVERSLKVGDEIGGHFVSGHVNGMAKIVQIDQMAENTTIVFELESTLLSRVRAQGFIALDGVSLTPVQVDHTQNIFSVGLIPTTRNNTLFGVRHVGDWINVEVEPSK